MCSDQATVKTCIKVHSKDNVAVALKDLPEGTLVTVNDTDLTLNEDIGRGHKFALDALEQGQQVIKYGYSIGYTLAATKKGDWIHTHNLKTLLRDDNHYLYKPLRPSDPTHLQNLLSQCQPLWVIHVQKVWWEFVMNYG